MTISDGTLSDVEQCAHIWYDGWQDAHRCIVPIELARVRTLASFAQRLRAGLAQVRVARAAGMPVGFHMLKHDELYQLYVCSQARGTGVADALIVDAEHLIRARGAHAAWLACAIGNHRAARFYERRGWRQTGTVTAQLEIPGGTFALEVWRYEKRLGD